MASKGFSKSGRQNSVKGFTYEIGQEQGIFSFAADAGENASVWFKKYSTPSAFEVEEAEFGSSWSWMGCPGAINSPSSGALNPEIGGKFAVHKGGIGTNEKVMFSINTGIPIGLTYDGSNFWITDAGADHVYEFTMSGTQVSSFAASTGGILQGITWDGSYLWLNDRFSDNVYQFTRSGTEVKSFASNSGGNPSGITWTGSYLFINDIGSDATYRIKTDGTKVSSFKIGTILPTDLTTDGVYIYSNDRSADMTYQLKTDGTVVSTTSWSSTRSPQGLTWDGRYHYYLDGASDTVYRIEHSNTFDVSYRVGSITK